MDAATTEYHADVTGDEPHPSHVLDVRVTEPVRTVERPARTFTTQQVGCSEQPQRVAPEHQARTALLLTNIGGATVYLAPSQQSATASTGFPLLAGAGLTLETVAEVWAVCTAGNAATLAVLAQHKDG